MLEFLKGRKLHVNGNDVVITGVFDYVTRERSAGILQGYAVVICDDGNEYVIFDRGEIIQNASNVVIGKTEPLFTE